MADLPDTAPVRGGLFDLHRSLGVMVFALVLARALWRAVRRPPALVSSMPRIQRLAAAATHIALYALMITVPLTGYLLTNLDGESVKVFGWALPALAGPDAARATLLGDLHSFAAYTLIALAALHALAAFRHHFMDRDETLARMVPGLRSRRLR